MSIGRDENGRRKRRWLSGFDTKRQAEQALTEALQRLAMGADIEPTKMTLGQFFDAEWLPSLRASVRPSTAAGYELLCRKQIIPAIGMTPLRGVNTAQLNALYADLLDHGRRNRKGGLAPATVRYVHVTLHKALRDAVRWGRLARNVADQATPPRVERAQPAVWTATELRTFLAHIADERLYALYHLAAATGLRRGEVLGLRWGDLDLDGGRLAITQTLISVGFKIMFSTPKTAKGRRSVALDGATIGILREHRKAWAEERLAIGPDWPDHDLVFTQEDGSLLHPDQVSKRFDKLVRSAGLPRIRFHALRHTHATMALQAGVHPKVVSERLGHASIAITLDVYSHAIPAMQEEAAEKVAALVASG